MKKGKHNKLMKWVIISAILVLIFILGLNYIVLRMDEDSWIKDSRGVWVKHGNPAETPDYVSQQKTMVLCAMDIYAQLSSNGVIFSSQCIGSCGNYSVDIVHVPRTAEDGNPENQCAEYLQGETNKFIELDSHGDVVRISE